MPRAQGEQLCDHKRLPFQSPCFCCRKWHRGNLHAKCLHAFEACIASLRQMNHFMQECCIDICNWIGVVKNPGRANRELPLWIKKETKDVVLLANLTILKHLRLFGGKLEDLHVGRQKVWQVVHACFG